MNFFADTPRLELFRLAGIPIKVDITFFLVPIFMLPTLERSLTAGILVVVGVFLSIVLHELGHALTARLFKVPVGEILVGGFYGYARMLQPAPSVAANIIILFAGPLANGLIFVLCRYSLHQPLFGFSGQLPESSWLYGYPAAVYTAFTLAQINLAMLVFNLLPAFPLDGGRIYRDMLSSVVSRTYAVRAIAALGVVVGVWSAFAALKYSIVLLLIGAQIAIMNWAIFKRPEDAEDR
jgi:Zn-dependent protease